MRIIPAIDILGGKCVRLSKGDFATSKVYNEDPLEVAKEFEDSGITYLHLVDLDGARSKMIVNYRILEKITTLTSLVVDFGGGIRSDKDLCIAFKAGASQVTAGTIALYSPDTIAEWLEKYGSEKIILGADSKRGKLAIEGWQKESEEDIVDWISDYNKMGIKYAICTDIEKDGMMEGPATELYKTILKRVKVDLIASGGVSTIYDIKVLEESGCEGVIIGKAIYEGNIKLKEMSDLC
jgi:phosphoribosylformimino-5-aminoimidazole carboxamide ribotide isomerase